MDDKTVKRLQRTTIGAQYPIHTEESKHYPPSRRTSKSEFDDEDELAKVDPVPEEALVRCARCGIEELGWTGGQGKGIERDHRVYCCESCANDAGCDCIAEAERHTGLNLAKGETDAAPTKPI